MASASLAATCPLLTNPAEGYVLPFSPMDSHHTTPSYRRDNDDTSRSSRPRSQTRLSHTATRACYTRHATTLDQTNPVTKLGTVPADSRFAMILALTTQATKQETAQSEPLSSRVHLVRAQPHYLYYVLNARKSRPLSTPDWSRKQCLHTQTGWARQTMSSAHVEAAKVAS